MTGTRKARSKAFRRYVLRLILIQLCIILIFAACSWLMGQNVFTFLLLWFVILPALSIHLSSKFLGNRKSILDAMGVMVAFYCFMIVMIYEHFQTDYFLVMMSSLLWNLLIMVVVWLSEQDDRMARKNHPG